MPSIPLGKCVDIDCVSCTEHLAEAYDQGMADWDAWPKPEPAMTAEEWWENETAITFGDSKKIAEVGIYAVRNFCAFNKGKVIQ